MINKSLIVYFFFLFLSTYAQEKPFWKSSPLSAEGNRNLLMEARPFEGVFELDLNQWQLNLRTSTSISAKMGPKIVTIPNAKGKIEQFSVVENSNFDPVLQAQYPNIQAFSGKGITDPNATVYFSSSPEGVQSMVLRSHAQSEFLEPIKGENRKYVLYRSDTRVGNVSPLVCDTKGFPVKDNLASKKQKNTASDRVFRTLRLALSCTGEYAAYHGGTVDRALAAMNATMTRVNGIFNRDLALKLVLIADNNKVIFTNAATDPYTSVVEGKAPGSWSQELETTVINTLGVNSYDIGHLFGASGGGGNAGCIGCICEADNARAYTSPSNNKPEGDSFDIDFVAHEFGHQLGATHTFSHEIEGTGTSVEPGSGTTIMSYAGITETYDVQKNADDYFSYTSINQIQENIVAKSCLSQTNVTSAVFGVNAGPNYTIPKNTPFLLKGTTTGAIGSSFTYVWEQNDSADQSFGDNSFAIPNKIDGPLFRSFLPSASLNRYFPSYDKVLVNRLNSEWESLSSIGRVMNFVFTGRDNGSAGNGQTASDATQITVSNTVGPFEITSQNTVDLSWNPGSTQTITWNVNGSNTLAGASNVTIKLSLDEGLTFPTILIANTPNDGSETIVVPSVAATKCRIMIEPTNSVFYALNSVPFAIGYTTVSVCNTYNFSTPITIPDGIVAYTTREIEVPVGLGEITDLTVDVVLTHSYISDVELEIVNPQNKTVRLLQRVCGGTNATLRLKFKDSGPVVDCTSASTQTISPTDLLSIFNGNDPKGKWLLRVRDAYSNDSGVVSSATVTICTTKATLGNSVVEIDDVLVLPNPSDGSFEVMFTSNNVAPVIISVTDVLGGKIYHEEFAKTTAFKEKITLKNRSSGVCFLSVTDGEKQVVKKIVVR